MAGGSADAAAALLACDSLWGTRLEREALQELAEPSARTSRSLCWAGPRWASGTGTHLTPALARGKFPWVFALADGGLSTPEVYAEYDRMVVGHMPPEPRMSDALMAALRAGDAAALGKALSNDLQKPALALRPRLQFTLDVGIEYGALGAIVSGSGPSCAFLARDESHALDLAVALSAAGVCRTVKRADGPVHGARVVDLGG